MAFSLNSTSKMASSASLTDGNESTLSTTAFSTTAGALSDVLTTAGMSFKFGRTKAETLVAAKEVRIEKQREEESFMVKRGKLVVEVVVGR